MDPNMDPGTAEGQEDLSGFLHRDREKKELKQLIGYDKLIQWKESNLYSAEN